jgi:5-methylcytosine-specific restriction endonuclease McrA
MALGWRYGWTCAFCGQVIDPTLTAPDPGAPTLHHVRPLVLGGRHDLANLRLAHEGCHREHHRATDRLEAA